MREHDVLHLGRDRVICCFEPVPGVLVDPGPGSSLDALLASLGDSEPRALLLTHIHLDHAGASGALVERFPGLEVYVHERGAPHLIDPAKLMASAGRLYGEENMGRLWGEVVPVPEERVHVPSGGEQVLGDFRVGYTPGHASHHVCFLHEPTGTAFTGDAAGVRIPSGDFTLAPSPPPDIDVEAWERSLELVGAWRPERLALTHFGVVDDVPGQLEATRRQLRLQAERARELDEAGFSAWLRADIAARTDADTAASYEQAAPPHQLYQGLERYWHKRAERERD